MFRKPQKPSSGKKPNLSQFGLLDIDPMDDDDEPMVGSDDDMDLEAELAAISGGGARHRPRKPAPMPAADLDAMIAASLKDIPSDDEGSGDDDDPELLSELHDLSLDEAPAPQAPLPRVASADSSTISLLQDRITNYTVAEKNAKAAGESSRARSADSSTISLLQDRITNYTVAEKNAKAAGESSRARSADSSTISLLQDRITNYTVAEKNAKAADLGLDEAPAPQAPLPRVASADSSTISLLQDRITNYTVAEKNAKAAGESGRARRFGRGLKTLNDLLKQAKAGATIANDDIPPPVAVAAAAPAAPEPAAQPRAPARPAPAIPDSPSSPPLPVEEAPRPPPRAASLRSPTEPPPALDPAKQEGLQTILKRKEEFRAAALAAKHTDKQLALEYLKVVKQFEMVADAWKSGQEMDLNELPTPEAIAAGFKAQQKGEDQTQGATDRPLKVDTFDMVADAWKSGQEMDLNELPTPEAIAAGFKAQQKGEDQTQGATEAPPEAPAPDEAPALITASTMAEALKQRLAGFQELEAKAKEQGNSSKARRMGRIVKQYQDAIKLHAAGKPVPVDELPPIAGYGPIPTDSVSFHTYSILRQYQKVIKLHAAGKPVPVDELPPIAGYGPIPTDSAAAKPVPVDELPPIAGYGPIPTDSVSFHTYSILRQYQKVIKLHAAAKPVPVDELPPIAGYGPIPTDSARAAPSPAPAPAAPRPAPPAARQASRYDKQLALLLHRQKEFRNAAIEAKKAGNIEQAKEYLRASKGFDAVIDAAKGGLAVDLKSLPLPPTAKKQLEHTFDVVTAEDCTPPDDQPMTGSDDDILTRLHQQLTSQLKLCQANRDHNRAMGNIAEMNRFENLAVRVKQDLDVVVVAKSLNQNPPKFHYESRQFAVVQCNTDLNENDLELTIVRGIAYNVPNPKEVDTYVKFEFPYPQDAPIIDRTSQVKDTNNPEYGAVFPLAIHRAARPCLRVFKRHGIKFEVYSKGPGGPTLSPGLQEAWQVRVIDRTSLVKDTNNPEYGAVFPLAIDRAARPCLRVVKRHGIKFEVYSKGCVWCGAHDLLCCSGWFARDSLLGACAVKLAPLETQVTIHEAFPLMDGRRPAGGSLEIKLRVRTPLQQQQIESTTHRWLVIDS
ncbi:coiled-coil and C2 domain-containing protein 1-like [Cydia amplana]|uniref:coiled-coil and C2 domain-containing protein 1-like n=1 Tax=Cydia amplana TaxID=1869771 RepID=UPI002FE62E41